MKVLVLIALVLTASCQANEKDSKKREKTPYDFKCTYDLESTYSGTYRMRRCENEEVICYIIGSGDRDGHSSCKFKN